MAYNTHTDTVSAAYEHVVPRRLSSFQLAERSSPASVLLGKPGTRSSMVREQTQGRYRQRGGPARRSRAHSQAARMPRPPSPFEPSWCRSPPQPRPQLSKGVLNLLQQLVNQGLVVVSGLNHKVASPAAHNKTTKQFGRPALRQAPTGNGRPLDAKAQAQQAFKAFPGKENLAIPPRRTKQQQQHARGVRKNMRRGGRRRGGGRRTSVGIYPPPAPHNTNSYLLEVHRPVGGYPYQAALEAAVREAAGTQPKLEESSGSVGSSGYASLGMDDSLLEYHRSAAERDDASSSTSGVDDDCTYGDGVLRINPPPAPLNDNTFLLVVHRPAGGWAHEAQLERALQASSAGAADDAGGMDDLDTEDEIRDLERILGHMDFGGAAAQAGAAAAEQEMMLVGPATPAQLRE